MLKKYSSIISIAAVLILCAVIIYFSGVMNKTGVLVKSGNKNVLYEKAKVLSIKNEKLTEDKVIPNMYLGYQELNVQVLTGKYKGNTYSIRNAMSRIYNVHAEQNMEVIVSIIENSGKAPEVSVYSHKREQVVYVLIALFFAIVVAIGKMKGVKAVVSLIFTGVMIMFFMIPIIFKGVSPILAAVIAAVIITIVTHLLISGWSKKTVAAMLGTITGVIIAGTVCFIAGNLAHLSGLTMDNAENLIYVAENSKFNVRGLMFAAILIASLGAVMDIGMSIASSIFEMHSINPKIDKKTLFNSGMNVGKDIIGTMSNTLILAFVGSSLTTLILIMASKMPYTQVINLDLICTELIQSISGSIGIVLTVPITAFIAIAALESSFKSKNSYKKPNQMDKKVTVKR